MKLFTNLKRKWLEIKLAECQQWISYYSNLEESGKKRECDPMVMKLYYHNFLISDTYWLTEYTLCYGNPEYWKSLKAKLERQLNSVGK